MFAASGVAHIHLMEAPEVALLQEAEDEIEQPRNEGSEESFPGEAQLHLGLSSRQQRHGCSARAVARSWDRETEESAEGREGAFENQTKEGKL